MALHIDKNRTDNIDNDSLQDTIVKIHENNGMVSLDKFGMNQFDFEKLNLLNIDFITTDVALVKNLADDLEKQKRLADIATYCMSKDIKLLVVGIEDKTTLEYVKKAGVRYVQGYYFARPDYKIMNINNSVKEKLEEFSQETIS